jgi:Na+/proline symporter
MLLAVVSIRGKTKSNSEISYLLANKETKLFPLIATLVMTELNPSTMLAFSGVAYFAGIWALSLPFVFLVGLGFYTVIVAKKWKEWDGYSVAEVFTKKYGNTMGKIASFLLLAAMIGFSSTYIKAMYLFFAPLFSEISQWMITLIMTLIVLSLNLKGGLRSIIRTDVFSFLAVAILLPTILVFTNLRSSISILQLISIEEIENGMKVLPFPFVFSLILLTMFTYIAAPWYGQKIVSSESHKTAKMGVGISSILVFVFYSFPILSVIFFKQIMPNLQSGQIAFPILLRTVLPESMLGFAYVLFFAIGATTLSGVWSAQTTMFIGDFLGTMRNHSEKSPRPILVMILFACLSYLGANLLIDQILDKLILANIPIFALSFSLLAGFYWDKASRIGAYTSTLVGVVWGLFTYLYFGEKGIYTFYWSVGGLPLIFGTGILISLLAPNKKAIVKKDYLNTD